LFDTFSGVHCCLFSPFFPFGRQEGDIVDTMGFIEVRTLFGSKAVMVDFDDTVVEVAAFAWGERTDGTASVARLSLLATTHEDSLCREAAVAALGSIGAPEGLTAVLAGCEDKATVRRRAVLSLAAFDGPEVTAMLERLCEDRDLQVRQAAEDLLAIERGLDV
jgi:HEAT repeat protein